jgi:hypothetical protein
MKGDEVKEGCRKKERKWNRWKILRLGGRFGD